MTTVSYVTKKGMFDATGMDALGYSDPKNDRILLRKGMDKATEMKVREHEFNHMQKGEEGPFLSAALGLAGSLISSKKQSDAAERAAEMSQYTPYNISGAFGSGTWNGQSGKTKLSAPYQSKRDYYLDQADFFNRQLGAFAPPTRDQFITGYDGNGRSRDDIYNDLLGSGGFKKTSGDAIYTDPVTGESIYVDPRGEGANPSWKADAARYVSKFGDKGSIGHFISHYMNNSDQGGFYRKWGGSETGTDYDALNAEADRLFNNQRGNAIYDDDAFNEARGNWKSPEQIIYDRLFKMAEPGESLERSSLENRLFSQGMLGSTGGGHRQKALYDAQAQKALTREHTAVGLAEEIQNQIQRRGINALNAATGVDSLPLEYLNLGARVGVAGANSGANAASYLNNAAQNQGDAISGFFSNLGNQVSDGVFSSPSTPPLNPYAFTNSGGNYGWGIK